MMKRIFVASATLLIALAVAAPSFALETKVTGTFTLDGILTYNPGLIGTETDTTKKQTIDYREMQLRINTESKVNDNITLYTRCNILDKIISSQYTNQTSDSIQTSDGTVASNERANIQFDRAWMDVKTPVGLFRVGRKEGVKWGTDFFDDGYDWGTDRLEYLLPIPVGNDKFVLGAVTEKAYSAAFTSEPQNRDNDKYYLTGTYLSKDWRSGLLAGYYDYNSYLLEELNGVIQTTSPTINATNIKLYQPRASAKVYYISPYFSGKLGPLTINAEFDYVTGKAKPKPNASATATMNFLMTLPSSVTGLTYNPYEDKDVTLTAFWLEGGYDIGPANIQLGYAYLSGDDDPNDDNIKSAAMIAPCADWGKVFILTSGMGIHGINANPKFQNITNIDSPMNVAGLSMPYIGANYSVTSSLNIGGIVAIAKADKTAAGIDKDYGIETDLNLSWKFLGNLEYKATAAYLKTGDFFKQGGTADVGAMIALYHKIILSF